MKTIYLDNAATSFPKPDTVSMAMVRYVQEVGAPLNRSVYGSAQEAELVTLSLREQLKRFFHFSEKATHVILTPGNTYGLNFLIKGYLRISFEREAYENQRQLDYRETRHLFAWRKYL